MSYMSSTFGGYVCVCVSASLFTSVRCPAQDQPELAVRTCPALPRSIGHRPSNTGSAAGLCRKQRSRVLLRMLEAMCLSTVWLNAKASVVVRLRPSGRSSAHSVLLSKLRNQVLDLQVRPRPRVTPRPRAHLATLAIPSEGKSKSARGREAD